MEINYDEKKLNEGGNTDVETPAPAGNKAVSYIFLIAMAVWGILFGILGLVRQPQSIDDSFKNSFEKYTVVEGYAEYGSNSYFIEYTHSINFIPAAKEYYYLIFSDDMNSAVSVRAPKSFGKKFDENFEANELVRIKGKVRKLPTKVAPSVKQLMNEFAASGIFVESENYVDLLSTRLYVIQIIIGAGNIIALLFLLSYGKYRKNKGKMITAAGKGSGAAAAFTIIICTVLFLYYILLML
ncbi:MAG: hypothetical protein IJ874_04675 [Ruminococcus sp.]|nr:hypothetical protein [Ruminococcus sp.]